MLKTTAIVVAFAAALAAPVAASTYSFVALDGYGADASDADLSDWAGFGDTEVSANALNITGSSVRANYSGTIDVSAYASTRYRYDSTSAKRVNFKTNGTVDTYGTGQALVIMAAWQVNSVGDLLWQDVHEYNSCAIGCEMSGFAALSQSWTRMAQAGDVLFLTITASAFFSPAALFDDPLRYGEAEAFASRTVSIAAVPEPASWALLITGFGLTGLAMRRRTVALAAWLPMRIPQLAA